MILLAVVLDLSTLHAFYSCTLVVTLYAYIFIYVFRIQKATESLRTFHPAADPCFDEFVLDTSREETLLKEMCFGGGKY